MVRHLVRCVSLLFLVGCSPASKTSDSEKTAIPFTAEEVIEASVDFHGGAAYDTADIHFVFRDKSYHGSWNNGAYIFSRMFEEKGHSFNDVLTNETFERMIDGQAAAVADTMVPKYSSSVNSVWYFAMLPYRLLDPAVQLEELGETTIRGKVYRKIEVTFAAEGGGEDFEDVFVYWFDKSDHSMDYLAYSYAEDHGIGLRFREAYNPRRIGGILWQDYVNYKADPAVYEVQGLDAAFATGHLDTLSMIELEDVVVK